MSSCLMLADAFDDLAGEALGLLWRLPWWPIFCLRRREGEAAAVIVSCALPQAYAIERAGGIIVSSIL